MPKSILCAAAEQIAAAIDTQRKAGGFAVSEFVTEWDFEGRVKDQELSDDDLHVRVIVPRKYDQIEREDKNTLSYSASFDVDVRQKLGTSKQTSSQDIEVNELDVLVRLVEQIHAFFSLTLNEARVELASHSMWAEWIDQRDGVPGRSQVLIAYSVKYLRERRQFYAVCRELFEVTA